MLRQLFFILTLSFLFGLGQQGAATHAIAHLGEWQEQQKDQAPHNPQCEECVIYASLASALTGQELVVAVIAQLFLPHTAESLSTSSSSVFPCFAGAPPVLA